MTSQNLAYVLFTSGSTGTPKGVAVTHASAVELVEWARTVYSDDELAGVLAATSLSFDLSVFELFVPLSWGGTVIVAANALALPELPARDRVRLINTVPSAMTELVRAGSVPPGVRTVNLAGEPLPRTLADEIYATGTVEALWNLYGPSEDTTYSTYFFVPRESTAPPAIGRPLAATRAYVVDEAGQPVPAGVAGELWLAGAGLARGYLHRPDLTAERFITDPFSTEPGARVYRTGDRVRWVAGGILEFLGRRDHQVKVRGFRIELGEIESVLRAHADVRDVVVVARESRLLAYVVASTAVAELREHVRARLPEYMVPAFVSMDALPLTPNGKVDRRALPEPDDQQSSAYAAPRDLVELRLARIWEDVLGRDSLGIRDDFFEHGGHSLLAVRLMARVEQELGVRVPLAALFQAPTIETFAAHVRGGVPPVASPLVPIRAAGSLPPLFVVHPIGGDVLCYRDLARALGADRPVYALQAEGVDGRSTPVDDVETMAARYVDAMRAVQPHGPYFIAGWSFGGLVAFEIARRLERQGEEIGQLVLLDSVPPGHDAYRNATPASFAMDLAARAGVKPMLRSAEPDLDTIIHEARLAKLLPDDAPASAVKALFDVYLANGRAGTHYRPAASSQRALLVQAEGNRTRRSGEVEAAWRRLLGTDLDVVTVPGDHYSILRAPHVERVGAEVEERLRAFVTEPVG